LHRPEYYDPKDESLRGWAEVIVAKQRNGPTGTVLVTYVASCTRFANREGGPDSDELDPATDRELYGGFNDGARYGEPQEV
jgi:replicative DNA helicase